MQYSPRCLVNTVRGSGVSGSVSRARFPCTTALVQGQSALQHPWGITPPEHWGCAEEKLWACPAAWECSTCEMQPRGVYIETCHEFHANTTQEPAGEVPCTEQLKRVCLSVLRFCANASTAGFGVDNYHLGKSHLRKLYLLLDKWIFSIVSVYVSEVMAGSSKIVAWGDWCWICRCEAWTSCMIVLQLSVKDCNIC